MSSKLLESWTTHFPPEKMLAAENSSLSLITLKQARLILDGLKQCLELQKSENEKLKANKDAVFQYSVEIYHHRPEMIMTAQGPVIFVEVTPLYEKIECYLNDYLMASSANSAMRPEEHNTILQSIIQLRQAFAIGQALHNDEDDYFSPIASLDHLSCQTKLEKLAAKCHTECEEILAPYHEKMEQWGGQDRTAAETIELSKVMMSCFEKQFEQYNIEGRAKAATQTLMTAFANNQFVADFLEWSLLEAEINNERFLPFFDLGKINYTASSSLIMHGICLGAHLEDPTRIPRYIAFAEQIKAATLIPRHTSGAPNPP